MVTQYTLSSLPFYAGDLELCIRKSALRLVYNILGNTSEHPMAILTAFFKELLLKRLTTIFLSVFIAAAFLPCLQPWAQEAAGYTLFALAACSYASCTTHRSGNLTAHPSHTYLQVSDPI